MLRLLHMSGTSNMDYTLAKQLEGAGFAQTGAGTRVAPPDAIVARRHDFAYVPTLEELIEAIGPEFVMVRNFRREVERIGPQNDPASVDECYDNFPSGEWVADSTRLDETSDEGTVGWITAHGHSALEATARLWLALQE